MKFSQILLSLLLGVMSETFSQTSSADKLTLTINPFLSIGRSTFHVNMNAPESFACLETRVGAVFTKRISDVFDIQSRLLVGGKFKRESYNSPTATKIGPPYQALDEVSSSRHHFFYEIPLLLLARVMETDLAFRAGANYRHYFADNRRVDFLTARGDLGIIGGVTYKLHDRLALGIEFSKGLTNLMSSSGSINGVEYTLKVNNDFGSFNVEYFF